MSADTPNVEEVTAPAVIESNSTVAPVPQHLDNVDLGGVADKGGMVLHGEMVDQGDDGMVDIEGTETVPDVSQSVHRVEEQSASAAVSKKDDVPVSETKDHSSKVQPCISQPDRGSLLCSLKPGPH